MKHAYGSAYYRIVVRGFAGQPVPCETEGMRHFLIVPCLLLSIGCSATKPHQRVVVVAAQAAGETPTPVAGAAVRIECPEGTTSTTPVEVTSDAQGEATIATAIPSVCAVTVSRDGYIAQSFRVTDICVEKAAEPYDCTAGVIYAPLLLEGRWNDADASATAAALYNECFAEPSWADGRPSIRLERLINKTDEHLDIKAIADRIFAAVVESPDLRVLSMQRGDETAPPADFHLKLEMTSLVTAREGIVDRIYSVTARVVRANDTEIVCMATAQRKKQTIQSKTTW